VVGIYLALVALSWWGAWAWHSWFMFGFGTLWLLVAGFWIAWFQFVEALNESSNGYHDP